jgi:hypothetical protein
MLYPKVIFPLKKKFVEEVLFVLVEKTLVTYVYIIICIKATHMFATCTFDLWMFIQVHNVFIMVINFVSSNWEPKHMLINLFEAIEISGVAMAPKLWVFFIVFLHRENYYTCQR